MLWAKQNELNNGKLQVSNKSPLEQLKGQNVELEELLQEEKKISQYASLKSKEYITEL